MVEFVYASFWATLPMLNSSDAKIDRCSERPSQTYYNRFEIQDDPRQPASPDSDRDRCRSP